MFEDINTAIQKFLPDSKTAINEHEYDSCKCRTTMETMFCPFGHMLECHYPKKCGDAHCSHYQIDGDVE